MRRMLNPHWQNFFHHFGKKLLFYVGAGGFFLYFLYTFETPFRLSTATWIAVSLMLLLLAASYHVKKTAFTYSFAVAAFLCCLYLLFTGTFDTERLLGAMHASIILYAALLPHAFGSIFLPVGYLWWLFAHTQSAFAKETLFGFHEVGLIVNFIVVNTLFLVIRTLQSERDWYRRKSRTEPLTGLFSSDYMLKMGRKWFRERRPFRLYIIDMDRFKQVNDTYGHKMGDDILKRVSYVLMELSILNGGIASRMGGDEFAVLVPDNFRTAALTERLRRRLETELFAEIPEINPVSFQFSIGEALSASGSGRSFEELLEEADAAMYRMKYERKTFQFDSDAEKYIGSGKQRSLLHSLGEKDADTYMRAKAAAEAALRFTKRLQLGEGETRDVITASWFHDVGNLLIPSHLLHKPGPLNAEEAAIVKEHVNHSVRILGEFGVRKEAVKAVSVHHERWDGGGYPNGVDGSNTERPGRVLQIVIAYAALNSGSLFKEHASAETVLAEIEQGAGTRFDPMLAMEFVNMERERACKAVFCGTKSPMKSRTAI